MLLTFLKLAIVAALGVVVVSGVTFGQPWLAVVGVLGLVPLAALEIRTLAGEARRARRPAGRAREPFTADDFPFPDPVPGGTRHTGGYTGYGDPPADDREVSFAVVVPRASATPHDLEEIGLRLRAWGAATRIIGLDALLAGHRPATPTEELLVPSPPPTDPVALVFVPGRAADEKLGASLAAALDGAAVGMVVSPAYYSMMNR
jgi:hypothetical protein